MHFVGRLGTYKYYNMDQVTAQALTLFSKLAGRPRTERAASPAQLSSSVPPSVAGSDAVGVAVPAK